jgi:hypothetical protein
VQDLLFSTLFPLQTEETQTTQTHVAWFNDAYYTTTVTTTTAIFWGPLFHSSGDDSSELGFHSTLPYQISA